MNELVKKENFAVLPGRFSKEQIETLQKTICKDLNESEMQLFSAVCERTGLDPFANQIYAIKRRSHKTGKETISFQTGIDGFRIIANRSPDYEGQEDPVFYDQQGKSYDVWLFNHPPYACRVGVFRRNYRQPIRAIAIYKEYKVDNNPLWNTKSTVMIAKCAEALALRKTFPNDLSGIYTSEEMGQANEEDRRDNKSAAIHAVASPAIVNELEQEQRREEFEMIREFNQQRKMLFEKIKEYTNNGQDKVNMATLLMAFKLESTRQLNECKDIGQLYEWTIIIDELMTPEEEQKEEVKKEEYALDNLPF